MKEIISSKKISSFAKKGISLAIILSISSLTLSPQLHAASRPTNQTPFKDISGSYAKEAIIRLYNKGIINGTSLTTFEPGKTVTRAELSKMLVNALQLDPVSNDLSPFTDLKPSDWYYGDISALVNLDMVQGRSSKTFAPKAVITREEAAALMVRMLKIEPEAIPSSSQLPYTDHSKVSNWALGYVNEMTRLGFMKGDAGGFRPKYSLTRAEAAMLLDRILQTSQVAAALGKKQADPITLGWQYDSTTAEFEQQILNSGINTLSPRWYFLDEQNIVKDNTDQRLVTFAKKHNLNIWGMVGNRANSEMTHRMLSDTSQREATVQKLVNYAKSYSLAGLNIDFENVSGEDRSYLTLFMASLYPKLKSAGITLSIDVSPDLGSSWTAAFDYEALGRYSDYVVLMGYEEHWNGSTKAGSVASLPWLEHAVATLKKAVPEYKIIAALPTYTRDWSLSSPQSGSYDITLERQGDIYRQNKASLTWDSEIAQYLLKYVSQGVTRGIWTEDSRSLSAKVMMYESYNIAGYAFWYMGSETPDVWTAMRNARTYSSYQFTF